MRKIVSRIANYPLGAEGWGGVGGRSKLFLVESHCPRDSQKGQIRCLSLDCYNQKPLPVFNQQAFVSHTFRSWKSKIKVLAYWVPGVPGLQTALSV